MIRTLPIGWLNGSFIAGEIVVHGTGVFGLVEESCKHIYEPYCKTFDRSVSVKELR